MVVRGYLLILQSVLYNKFDFCEIQSTLVISTSAISNNRLSRKENLVPVFNTEI